MSNVLNTVDLVGDAALTNLIISRSVTEIADGFTLGIGREAFRKCNQLTKVDFQAATSMGYNAFYQCENLREANLPMAGSIPIEAFYACRLLQSVNAPMASVIGRGAFEGCWELSSVNIPAARTISSDAFRYDRELQKLDLPALGYIDSQAFRGCAKLSALIIRSETMATLDNADAFANTLIASGTGYIYVPAALVDSYKAASNWSTYAAQFRAIEDYTVDGTTTGALDETKI